MDSTRLDNRQMANPILTTPPDCLLTIHTILTTRVNNFEKDLKRLHHEFYGEEGDEFSNLMKLGLTLKPVLSNLGHELCTTDQVEILVKREIGDLVALIRLEECTKKLLEAVPSKFTNLISELRGVLPTFLRYCVSFYDPGVDPHLPTALSYENQRNIYTNAIEDKLVEVENLSNRFQTEGLRLNQLSSYSVELAHRTQCEKAPFLLLFVEACEQIRFVLKTMTSWISDDVNYEKFLANDVKEMEMLVRKLSSFFRIARPEFYQMSFRLKLLQSECRRLDEELLGLRSKEDELIVEQEMLEAETQDLKMELESTEFRKKELSRMPGFMQNEALSETYRGLAARSREIKTSLPCSVLQLTTTNNKLQLINEKKTKSKEDRKKIESLEKDLNDLSKQLEEYEVEYTGTVNALETARRIIMLKKSPDVIQKLFYNQPVEGHKLKSIPTKGARTSRGSSLAKLNIACRIVVRHIDKDWSALYQSLPFSPPRGMNNIERDIARICNADFRGQHCHLAEQAIVCWRRHNNRARYEDLLEALERIQRKDVHRRIERSVSSPEPEVVIESEVPDWLDRKLVPFWREIERYDKYRSVDVNHESNLDALKKFFL